MNAETQWRGDAGGLKAPFPWFGGKSWVAGIVWGRFGDVANYVEPFFGSGAVLLGRPHEPRIETVNDKDGFVSNFWRAIAAAPDEVARHADWPVNENDLHARHVWLVSQTETLVRRLEGDADFYDAKVAGWWCWGICCWIGSGFCSGRGSWQIVDGELVKTNNAGRGVQRQLVHLSDAGQGVQRKLVHLGNAGRGVQRQLVQLRGEWSLAKGAANKRGSELREWMGALSERLRRVRVCCGDWSRVMGPSVTFKNGLTGVFLDPPYSFAAERDNDLYREESGTVGLEALAWGIANGENPLLRICFCGYEGEHAMPEDWDCVAWKSNGGYGLQGDGSNRNAARERLWFSPHCLKPEYGQLELDWEAGCC